ncbi:MAG: hypothetical protein ACKODX_09925, partial [Gemmata sp.]
MLLDSAERHSARGRYSYVSADPVEWLNSPDGCSLGGGRHSSGGPFVGFQRVLREQRLPTAPELPPFQWGLVGSFGYDLNRRFEALPPPRADEFQVPAVAAGIYDCGVSVDHETGRAWAISTGYPETRGDQKRVRRQRRLDALLAALRGARRDAVETWSRAFAASELVTQHPL